ncbi:hypothetical protein MMPV_002285 [Pyropia vietnamensis]
MTADDAPSTLTRAAAWTAAAGGAGITAGAARAYIESQAVAASAAAASRAAGAAATAAGAGAASLRPWKAGMSGAGSPAAAAAAAYQRIASQPLRMVGRTGLVYAAMGGVFATVEDTLVSLRDGHKDIFNGAVAGCASGMVFGVSSQKLSVGAGMCASLAAVSAFLETVNLTMGPTVRVPHHEKRAKEWGIPPPAAAATASVEEE